MNQQLLDAAESWLTLNDAFHTERLEKYLASERGPATLLADAPGMPIVSAACLVGSEREKVLNGSRAIKAALGTPTGLELFKQDPMNGLTSILNMARTKSGYNPLNTEDPKRKEKYDAYLANVNSAPYFTLLYADNKQIENSSKNWDVLIDAITATFDGLANEDKSKIVSGLGALAKAAASSKDSKQSEDLFVQNVLQAEPGIYEFFLYSSHVTMEAHTTKGSTSKQSSFQVSRAKFRFPISDWPYLAEAVWNRKVKATDDWLNENTTPAGSLKSNLCLASLRS